MIKKTALLVAVLVGAGVAVDFAGAATSHSFNQTGIEGGPIPNPHGILMGTLGSKGAIREHRIAQGTTGSFSGTTTLFEPKGSFAGTITTGQTTDQNGGFKETVKITGGGGLYKGASGNVTITGKHRSGPAPFDNITVTGTIRY